MGIQSGNKVQYADEDPRQTLLDAIGDVDDIKVFNNQVLIAVYTRPGKTKGGVIMPGGTKDEDKYQSKVGLIVAMGPSAFVDDNGAWFKGAEVKLHDWVLFRPSDGWELDVNETRCRFFDDTRLRAKIPSPSIIW